MNAIFYRDAALFQSVREVAHCVLRLRGCQAEARHYDNLAGVGKPHRSILQRDLAHLSRGIGTRRMVHRAETAKQHIRDRAVHRLAHQNRENEARETIQCTGNDQDVVAQHESGSGGRQPRVTVQQ